MKRIFLCVALTVGCTDNTDPPRNPVRFAKGDIATTKLDNRRCIIIGKYLGAPDMVLVRFEDNDDDTTGVFIHELVPVE